MRRLLIALGLVATTTMPVLSQAIIGRDIDHVLTPGAIGSTKVADVCGGEFELRHNRITQQLANAVFDRYGVSYQSRMRLHYRITFLVPPGLGGDNVMTNLWPADPQTIEHKDEVDTDLHQAVCSGLMDLREAQRRIRANWETAVNF